MSEPNEEQYATIRDLIGEIIGRTVVDITQHDEEYFIATGQSFVDLMFDSGDVLRIHQGTDRLFTLNPSHDEPDEIATH